MLFSYHMDIRTEIAAQIKDYLVREGAEAPVTLERPNSLLNGDLTTSAAFAAAKALKKSPLAVAEGIAAYLTEQKLAGVTSATAAVPGFVNIHLSDAVFSDIAKASQGVQYGANDMHTGEVWALEHTSPNPNKAMHLGHLRNNLVSMSVGRLLEASGASVIYEAVDNNRGIAIAKLMWGYLAHMKKSAALPTDVSYWVAHKEEWYTPEERGMLPDVFVSECYVLGDGDSKDPATEEKIRALVVAWEANDANTWELWKFVLAYSYAGMDRTLARLKNRWDVVWHEHEHYEKGKEYVSEGLKRGVFKKLDDGAVLTQLDSYNIPDTILLKRDGTSLYITQDIALTALKRKDRKVDHLVWVVGPDQTLALRQLFAVCEQLGIGKLSDFTHVSYGYVGLKDEHGGFRKMSSREGTVVLIDDVIDSVRDALLLRESEDGRKATPATAELLALAAVKFSILKSDRTQDLQFDVERSIETKGDSGIYVMYTYVRTRSLLRKAAEKGSQAGETVAVNDATRLLQFYPDVVAHAVEDLSVHHVAQYLLELCGAFNAWYAHEIVLDGSDKEAERLALVLAVSSVIAHGLALMNIDTVEEI